MLPLGIYPKERILNRGFFTMIFQNTVLNHSKKKKKVVNLNVKKG